MNREMMKKEIVEYFKLLLFWFVVFFIVTKFLINPVHVIGNSMYPTLKDDQRGFSSIISKNFDIERFDVVVVEAKDNPKNHWVKRIIGMPNETIECKDDVLYINGVALEEDFLDAEYVEEQKYQYGSFTSDFGPITLEDDEYFLLGDNRTHSTDSRVVGAFSKDEITSLHVWVYYPFDEMGLK